MQTIKLYASANSPKGTIRDYANARNATAPFFTKAIETVLKLRLFDDSEGQEPYPLAELQACDSFYCVFDRDYSSSTTPLMVADNSDISVASVTESIDGISYTYTEVTIPISNTNTSELSTWLGTDRMKNGIYMELVGYKNSASVFDLQLENFGVLNRLVDTGTPTQILPEYLTASQVRSLVASGVVIQFSADGTNWHTTQASTDGYVRYRSASDATSTWSTAIVLPAGQTGPSGTMSVGTVTTLEAGASAYVSNVGTASSAILNFGIPKGAQGSQGVAGSAATVTVASVVTLAAGASAYVSNIGTSSAASFVFGIPQGAAGSGNGDMTKATYDTSSTGSRVDSALNAASALVADVANSATNATNASYAAVASSASSAGYAASAGTVGMGSVASNESRAVAGSTVYSAIQQGGGGGGTASYASSAAYASSAGYASSAAYASSAGYASSAAYASSAGYASSASVASNASEAGFASSAYGVGIAAFGETAMYDYAPSVSAIKAYIASSSPVPSSCASADLASSAYGLGYAFTEPGWGGYAPSADAIAAWCSSHFQPLQ